MALVPVTPKNTQVTAQMTNKRRKRNRRSKRVLQRRVTMSDAGMAFLKCAFAPPDFSIDPGMGIPDTFQGRTLSIKDCFTGTITAKSQQTVYILVAPIPGFAYFINSQTSNESRPIEFQGVPFPTYKANFGIGQTGGNLNYSKFRYASSCVGVYPTCNYMTFNGSIQVWKAPLSLGSTEQTVVTDVDFANNKVKDGDATQIMLSGTNSIVTVPPRDNYSASFIDGCYAVNTDLDDFEWNEFRLSKQFTSDGKREAESGRVRLVSAEDTWLTGL